MAVRSSLARFALRASGLTLLLAAIAAFAVRSWVGESALPSVAWASGIALVGALLGRLAGLLVPSGRPEAPAQAALLGMGVRLLATAGMCLGAVALGAAPGTTFVVVVAVQYLALLVLEVGQAVAEVRAMGVAPQEPPGGGTA